MPKYSSLQVKERRNEVMEMMLKGYTKQSIIEKITEDYSCKPSTVVKDIAYAHTDMYKYYDFDPTEMVKEHIAKYDKIIEQAEIVYDFNTKLKAMQQKEKLLNLHSPDFIVNVQNNNTTNTVNLENLSVEELKSLLNR